jgi:hypothetical protein
MHSETSKTIPTSSWQAKKRFCARARCVSHCAAQDFFDGKMWNAYSRSLVTKEGGAAKVSILTMKNGIVTRGVLYDIPKLKGVPYLDGIRESGTCQTRTAQ